MNFESEKFNPCREWIAQQRKKGKTWEEIEILGDASKSVVSLLKYKYDEDLWPKLNESEWQSFVSDYQNTFSQVTVIPDPVVGIDANGFYNHITLCNGLGSSWEELKKYLSNNLSSRSLVNIENSCKWILNHLKNDTRDTSSVKGLVTGSVQSGKTVNMEGLVSMAADSDWNFFIILSGSIENLRKQTRDRFIKDLRNSESGILWQHLDFTGKEKSFQEGELKLNNLYGGKTYITRYVTVCLKNKGRLEKLLEWLHDDPNRAQKLRLVIIDDEADQASINTAEITPDEYQERCAINELIVNLVNGNDKDGKKTEPPFQAVNYICYTATPYANVLNEAGEESLYPKDFICTLPESTEYFGPKVIFGNSEEDYPGFDIIRQIPYEDEKLLKEVQKGEASKIPESLKTAIGWFLCASAILRKKGWRKSISMLIHTSAIQNEHFILYKRIMEWFKVSGSVISACESAYAEENEKVGKSDLLRANPEYGLIDQVEEVKYSFEDLFPEIERIIKIITNIKLGDNKTLSYCKGLHICVDNCKANKEAEEGTFLRIIYPSDLQIKELDEAPVFLVIGGNTLSRGLTIDGLLCTYFARNSNQADTLMQMARWFGYRKGYELLQRIWMTNSVEQKFKALSKIDMDLKKEIEGFMQKGISPSQLGPRIRNIPEIAKFRITAKKKSQSAVYDDFDFCGDSYETTDFDNDNSLKKNLDTTYDLIKFLGLSATPRKSTTSNAFVWDNIDYQKMISPYLDQLEISKNSSLSTNFPYFRQWMVKMNEKNDYLHWNVAVVDGDDKTNLWEIYPNCFVGCIVRRRKASIKNHIDIGSLRSGVDVLSDVDECSLNPEQIKILNTTKKTKKNIISARSLLNLKDKPLLLLYRIKKDGGENTKTRLKMNALCDIIGVSIIVSGDSIGEDHARTLHILIPGNSEE